MKTTYTYRTLPEARHEIMDAANYYLEGSESKGEAFLALVDRIEGEIHDNPFVGASYRGDIRYRVLNHHTPSNMAPFRYTLYYDVHDHDITLIACWFQDRNPVELDDRIAQYTFMQEE